VTKAGLYILTTSEKFSHPASVLIQGLTGIGFPVATSMTNPESDGRHCKVDLSALPIEKRDPRHGDDLMVLDVTTDLTGYTPEYLNEWFENIRRFWAGRTPTLLYSSDDANYVDFPEDFRVFHAHRNCKMDKNPHAHALAFGCSQELLLDADRRCSSRELRKALVVDNFNPSFRQSVRESLMLSLLPRLERILPIDRRLLYGSDYGDQLATSFFMLAYGGEYVRPKTDFWYLDQTLSEIDKQRYTFRHREVDIAVFRWDSWRFWEGLAYGCIPIQLDFEFYGFDLPVKPVGWEHYVPIRLDALEDTASGMEQLLANPRRLEEMGRASQRWVQGHYQPQAVAERFLNTLGVSRVP
jgi:hypothetical protein